MTFSDIDDIPDGISVRFSDTDDIPDSISVRFSDIDVRCNDAEGISMASSDVDNPDDMNGDVQSEAEISFYTTSGGASSLASLAAAVGGETANPPAPPVDILYMYNPVAGLPPRLVRCILEFEFVKMSDLLPDSWLQEENQPVVTLDGQVLTSRRLPRKAQVQDITLWTEYYSRMAAVLMSRFPNNGPELWAYQASIVRAARKYEGTAWVAYDRQYRREALAGKCLNWSRVNPRLYSEAFTGRAKAIQLVPPVFK
ncbi:hypothetical protein EMCRGX_G014550 [Ephydatia muelleri]